MWKLILTLFFSFPVFASTQSFYGLGAANIGLANSSLCSPQDAFSQSYNPALMAHQPGVLFSFGLQGAITQFDKINQVKVDDPDLGGSSTPTDNIKDVDTKTPDVFLASMGLKLVLGKRLERPLHLGLNIVTPIDRILGIETQDAFVPQYTMYLSDSQRLTMSFNLARKLSDAWTLGVSVDHYLVQGATARVRLPSGGNSTTKLKMDARSGLSPGVALLYQPSGTWSFSGVYKYKKDYRSEMDLNNTINILTAPSPLYMSLTGSLYYDPENLSLGVSRKWGSDTLFVAARYDRWSQYAGPVMRMSFANFTTSLSQTLPSTQFHDVVNLFTGFERKWSATVMRLGYSYMPTPVPDQSGALNFVDSDRHVVTGGYGLKWHPEWMDNPLHLDMAGFLHYLNPKTVTKTSAAYIGAPGYKIGGMVYGYALTFTTEF